MLKNGVAIGKFDQCSVALPYKQRNACLLSQNVTQRHINILYGPCTAWTSSHVCFNGHRAWESLASSVKSSCRIQFALYLFFCLFAFMSNPKSTMVNLQQLVVSLQPLGKSACFYLHLNPLRQCFFRLRIITSRTSHAAIKLLKGSSD